MATKRFEVLDEALDAVSYEWLSSQHPMLVEAISTEIGRGLTPRAIRLRVQDRTDRLELALRCEQAARHLARVGEVE